MTTEWIDRPTEPGLWWVLNPDDKLWEFPRIFQQHELAEFDCDPGEWPGYRFARCDAKPPDPPATAKVEAMMTDRTEGNAAVELAQLARRELKGTLHWSEQWVRLCNALDPPQPEQPEPVLPDVRLMVGELDGYRVVYADDGGRFSGTMFWMTPGHRGNDIHGKIKPIRPLHADVDRIANLKRELATATDILDRMNRAMHDAAKREKELHAKLADVRKVTGSQIKELQSAVIGHIEGKKRLQAALDDLRKHPPDRELMADVETWIKEDMQAAMNDGNTCLAEAADDLLARVRAASDPVKLTNADLKEIAGQPHDNVHEDEPTRDEWIASDPPSIRDEMIAQLGEREVLEAEKDQAMYDDMLASDCRGQALGDYAEAMMRYGRASDTATRIYNDMDHDTRQLADISRKLFDAFQAKASDPPLSRSLRERCIAYIDELPVGTHPQRAQLIADLQAAAEPPGITRDLVESWIRMVRAIGGSDAKAVANGMELHIRKQSEPDDERCSFVGHPPNPRYVRSDEEMAAAGIKPLRDLEPPGITREPVVTVEMLERWMDSLNNYGWTRMISEMQAARDKLREGSSL